MRVGVVIFPGTNCERETLEVPRRVLGWDTIACPHDAPLAERLDLVILPGGFSHGDYLRAGALAALSPVLDGVREFAERGGPVLGICNGFQILCEAGLLPGTLRRNRDLAFVCEEAYLKVERRDTEFTSACPQLIHLPIAHAAGRYHADAATLARLEKNNQVVFRYVGPLGDNESDAEAEAEAEANPNGSLNAIAGIVNEAGNVCGMMPHPERACEPILGGSDERCDGLGIFQSLAAACATGRDAVAVGNVK